MDYARYDPERCILWRKKKLTDFLDWRLANRHSDHDDPALQQERAGLLGQLSAIQQESLYLYECMYSQFSLDFHLGPSILCLWNREVEFYELSQILQNMYEVYHYDKEAQRLDEALKPKKKK